MKRRYSFPKKGFYLLSQTLEKVILPYITQNIPNITTQHGFKTKHSTNTALNNINNTVATGFNQPIPPTRTIAVALDMSKAFDTVNIHTLIEKFTQTNIPHTILRYIANYIKGRMAYTTFRNHTSNQNFHKAASTHPYSSTSTIQTSHYH